MAKYSFDIQSKENVNIVCDDGIRFIKAGKNTYDLILNTVTSPLYFSSSKLYTRDFFKQVKTRLKTDGVYTTWLDFRVGDHGAQIILKSVQAEFKYCWMAMLRGSYYLLLCSNKPIFPYQKQTISRHQALKNYFLKTHARDLDTIDYAIVSTDAFQCLSDNQDIPFNSIDLPSLEFEIARLTDRSISDLKHCIKENYNPQDIQNKVLGPRQFDFNDLVSYSIDSSYLDFFSNLARQENPGFVEQFSKHMLRHYQTVVQAYPADENLYRLASWYQDNEMYDKAGQVLHQILESYPDYYGIRHFLGINYYYRENYWQALKMFKAQLAQTPSYIHSVYWLGKTFYRLKQYQDAIAAFQTSLILNPWYDNANYRMGKAHLKLEDKHAAKRSFKKELLVDPEDEDAKVELNRLVQGQ